jgi:hypothetical protein
MGMDVYGNEPTSEVGEYFRRNVWGWHPLWEYVENIHPEIAELVEHGHSNDGDGLNASDSVRLAKLLQEDLGSGTASEYIAERGKMLADLPKEECRQCHGTGIRTDEAGVAQGMSERELSPEIAILTGRTKGWCNGCHGEGFNEPFATNYYLEEEDIREFADFLLESGGFKIC